MIESVSLTCVCLPLFAHPALSIDTSIPWLGKQSRACRGPEPQLSLGRSWDDLLLANSPLLPVSSTKSTWYKNTFARTLREMALGISASALPHSPRTAGGRTLTLRREGQRRALGTQTRLACDPPSLRDSSTHSHSQHLACTSPACQSDVSQEKPSQPSLARSQPLQTSMRPAPCLPVQRHEAAMMRKAACPCSRAFTCRREEECGALSRLEGLFGFDKGSLPSE